MISSAHQRGQREAVEEHVAQDVAFVAVPLRGRRRDDDALRVDHLAHDAAGAVGRGHQHRREAELLGRDLLQAAEQHVRRRVGAGQRDAEPAEHRAEERIEPARVREGEAQRRVEARALVVKPSASIAAMVSSE